MEQLCRKNLSLPHQCLIFILAYGYLFHLHLTTNDFIIDVVRPTFVKLCEYGLFIPLGFELYLVF